MRIGIMCRYMVGPSRVASPDSVYCSHTAQEHR